MLDKHILIAHADLPTLGEYGRDLGKEWNVTLVSGASAARAKLSTQPYDVIVADADLPEINGIVLLDQVQNAHPKTIRILLIGEDNKGQRIADVQGSHLVLGKPCDNPTLKSAIERALSINRWLANDSLRELVGRLRTFPIVPSLYLEVVNALKTSSTTTAEIGAIIAKDMAMMTKLLQVTNSACFGLPRKISDPVEAVGILGFETVKSMVMTLKLLSQYDKVKPVYFSIDRLWRHSTEVARIAKRLALTRSTDPVLAESAFAAGLMHDLGKLVLAANFDEQYSGAQGLARKQQIPLWEVEKQIFGASHGEIGAYLLGLWGMPLDVVEVAALHHDPSRSQGERFNALTAVHVANALVYEVKPDKEGFVPPRIDEAYLARLGVAEQLSSWRGIVTEADVEVTQFRTRSGDTMSFKKPAAAEQKSGTRPAKSVSSPVPTFSRSRWLYGSLGVAVFLLLFWLGTNALMRRTLGPSNPVVAQAAPKPPVAAALTPPPSPTVVKAAVKTNEYLAPKVALATPVAVSNAPVPAAPPPPPPAPSAKDMAFAELELQSIFYSRTNPTAVISGQSVHTSDRLPAGAKVVAIGPTSVTLEFESERKTLALNSGK